MKTFLQTIAALGAVWALAACTRPEAVPPVLPSVFVTPVHNDTGNAERIMSAVIRPRIESELAFRAGGKVMARLVEVGQTVRAGQMLGRIDPADYQLAVDAAAEQLRAADVDAAQAASDAARFKRLLVDGSVGAADQERQQARADAAAARLAQARRQLDLARNRAGYAALLAPFDGIVTALRFEAGQMVPEGQAVMTLARPGELEVLVDVPEALAADLYKQRATVRVGGREDALALRLRELSPSASAQTRTFRARYAFASPPSGADLRMGTTAELHLGREGATLSALLPVSALLVTTQTPSVWIADEKTGALARQPVQLVSQTTDSVRVAGLADGALVVSVGAQKLDAGLKVQTVRRPLEAIARAEGRP